MPHVATNRRLEPWLEEIARKVSAVAGIQLGPKQEAMIDSRVRRRMAELSMPTPEAYVQYLEQNATTELNQLVNLLTTHHSYFFREYSHFEYLDQKALKPLTEAIRKTGRRTLLIWSAACSHGQEAYSLAMFLAVHLKKIAPDFSFEILGTDVGADVVKHARNAVYRYEDVKEVPSLYLGGNWLRGTGDISDFVRAKTALRNQCHFEVGNLLNIKPIVDNRVFDIVFCRNVYIYFNSQQIQEITANIFKHLHPEGYFFIGTSETLRGLKLPITSVAPSVYVHEGSAAALKHLGKTSTGAELKVVTGGTPTTTLAASAAPEAKPAKIRVLCVDDSPSILTLLKKIFEGDFDVVATAKNGLEAAAALKTQKVDLVTLDLHMPEQDGIGYLKANFNASHPPVVVISSVPREDSALAMQALQLGAVDYIEKPTLQDLSVRSEEIRTKARCAALAGSSGKVNHELSRSFAETLSISQPEKKARVVLCGVADRAKLESLLPEFSGTQPPTLLVFEGASGILPALKSQFATKTKARIEIVSSTPPKLENDCLYLVESSKVFSELRSLLVGRALSAIVFTDASERSLQELASSHSGAHLIVEEAKFATGTAYQKLIQRAKYLVPYTSMAYHSNEYLAKTK